MEKYEDSAHAATKVTGINSALKKGRRGANFDHLVAGCLLL